MLVMIKSAPDTTDGALGLTLAKESGADLVLLQNGVYFAQKERLGSRGIMAFDAGRRRPFLLRVARILRMAVGASLGVVTVFQAGLGVAHDPVGGQGHEKPLGRPGRIMTLAAGLWQAGSLYRRLRVRDLAHVMGRVAILAFRGLVHAAFEHHPVGRLLVGLRRILVAVDASDFGEALRRMDVRLGFLVAVRASHPGRSVNRCGIGLIIHAEREEGPVLLPLAEFGVLVTLETFRVIGGQGSADPEEA